MLRNIIASVALSLFLANSGWCQQRGATAQDYTLPKFKTDSPQFCFLKFPAGNSKYQAVLIVTDGSTLFYDRNANRDLTESDEFVNSTTHNWQSDRDYRFQIDQIRVGALNHRSVRLEVSPLENYDREDRRIKDILKLRPKANCFGLSAEIEDERFHGKGFDGRVVVFVGISDFDGILQFGDSVATAPTINFCGELEIRLSDETKLRPDAVTDVVTVVGIPGKGSGTFALIGYEDVIPESIHPKAILEVTSLETGQTTKTEFELGHRC